MKCGTCNDATSCATCNAGYENLEANGATVVCTKIPEPQPEKASGSTWLWWLLGGLVVILIVVGVACMVMKSKAGGSYGGKHSDDGFDNSREGDDNIEM